MNLTDLLAYNHIAIQCHDDPDADAVAAGFALQAFCVFHGKETTLLYSGRTAVRKPNMLKMLELFRIPLEYHPSYRHWPELLVTVDCQHGSGNVSAMSAPVIAVLDHHIQEAAPPILHDIRPFLGSCSTLVWALLREAGFFQQLSDSERCNLLTALRYGLYMDTGAFDEVRHPLDRDLRDVAEVNASALKVLHTTSLTRQDLAAASSALNSLRFIPSLSAALVEVPPCDSNLLGCISDLVIQADDVDTAVAFSIVPGGIKYSVRTVSRSDKASELALWLAGNALGSGGGQAGKAGGWLSAQRFASLEGSPDPLTYFSQSLKAYKDAYTVMDCREHCHLPSDHGPVERFEKKPVRLAYVACDDMFPQKTVLHIRMLEGDIRVSVVKDAILMIGIRGEVYPLSGQRFEATYSPTSGSAPLHLSYEPVVIDSETGERIPLSKAARPCVSKERSVLACRLNTGLKVFTRWDADNHVTGDPGDWLVWTECDPADKYIVKASVFSDLYSPVTPGDQSQGATGHEDWSDVSLYEHPASLHVRKKPVRVTVRHAREAGVVDTLEGPVPFAVGDVIIHGVAGEAWPMPSQRFMSGYEPIPPTLAGEDGVYRARPSEALALRMSAPFSVRIHRDAILFGRKGDWLLQYSGGDYGIVSRDLFETLYAPCKKEMKE